MYEAHLKHHTSVGNDEDEGSQGSHTESHTGSNEGDEGGGEGGGEGGEGEMDGGGKSHHNIYPPSRPSRKVASSSAAHDARRQKLQRDIMDQPHKQVTTI